MEPGGGRLLLGREHELGVALDALARAAERSRVVVVEGDAGIGKTSLVHATLEAATSAGHRLAVCRPTPAETGLAFAALADLLAGDDLGALDDVSRRAIEVALGRREGRAPLTHELGAAFVQWMETVIGEGRSLVMIVDDVQWLDRATLDVLRHALRRLPPAGVCVLVAQRTDGPDSPATASTITPLDTLWIHLDALPAGPVERLVHGVAARALPVHVVERIVRTAAGNPLYAIELTRSMRDGAADPGRPLRVPPSLRSLIAEQLSALPAATVEVLAAVSMLARPTVAVLDRLGMLDELPAAEAADVVRVVDRHVDFRHPLLASGAHDAVTATQRLALHRRLATVTDGVERCRHLALAATEPDAALAAELADGVRMASARGASAEAAELAHLALTATPADDPLRWERMLLAGDVLFRAGRTDEAVQCLQRVADASVAVELQVRALLAIAIIEYSRTDDTEVASEPARRVLALADDPKARAEAHTILARVDHTDFVTAAEHAEAALALLRRAPDVSDGELAQAINAAASARFLAGYGLDRGAFEQAIELERGIDVSPADSAFAALAALLKYVDQLDEAEAMLDELARRSDPASLPYALGHLPQLMLWEGRFDDAERAAHRHLQLAEQTLQEAQAKLARFNLAQVAAFRGDIEEAEPIARQLADTGREGGIPWTERSGAALLGFLAMSAGDAASAVAMFERYEELGRLMRLGEPGYQRFHGDHVEALLATGRVERAEAVVAALAPVVEPKGPPSVLAALHRSRSLIAAHHGDRDGAFSSARAAIATLEGTRLVYEQARAELTLGMVARRFKERGVAREALTAALDRFERMGATSLAERARRELGRVSGRAPSAPQAELTSTEQRVAELAAAGRTTRQIAAELFISAKTVEANLTRVYRKLDVANRAQLANRLTGDGGGTANT